MASRKLMGCREKHHPAVIQSRRLRSGGSARKSLHIVHMSDTHGNLYDVPNGDILIHSGDFTNHGIQKDLEVEPLPDIGGVASSHLPSMQVGYLQVQGDVELVLDLDAADPQKEMVFLWKKLPGLRKNQLWHLTGAPGSGQKVQSMCNGQKLRFMGSDLKASSNTFAEEMIWADGWLISPGGCTVVVPGSLRSGQALGLAPIDLRDALRFSFVPVET